MIGVLFHCVIWCKLFNIDNFNDEFVKLVFLTSNRNDFSTILR